MTYIEVRLTLQEMRFNQYQWQKNELFLIRDTVIGTLREKRWLQVSRTGT